MDNIGKSVLQVVITLLFLPFTIVAGTYIVIHWFTWYIIRRLKTIHK